MKYSLRLTFSLALTVIGIRVSNHKSTSSRATLEIPRDDEISFPYSRCTRDDNREIENKAVTLIPTAVGGRVSNRLTAMIRDLRSFVLRLLNFIKSFPTQDDSEERVIPAKAGIWNFIKVQFSSPSQDSHLRPPSVVYLRRTGGNDQVGFPIKQLKSLRACLCRQAGEAMSLHKPKLSWNNVVQILPPMNRDQDDGTSHSDPESVRERNPHNLKPSWDNIVKILRKCAQDDCSRIPIREERSGLRDSVKHSEIASLSLANGRLFHYLLMLFLLAIPSLTNAQTATIPSGSGTAGDPYLISSLENLYWLSQSDTVWDDNAYFLQTADIDASATSGWNAGAGFTPIGNVTTAFTGSYDGGGFTIANLFINLPLAPRMGLFGRTNSATITNTGLVQANITGSVHTGALVGFAEAGSIIKNSYSSGSVSGNSNIGGLIGSSSADSVFQVYSLANVTSSGSNSGVLLGRISGGILTDSYATGDVSGLNSVGGLVGNLQSGSIENSYSTSLVTAVNTSAGGVVGSNGNFGTITSTYWDTEASGESDGIGVDNNSQTVTGLTSVEMQRKSSFSGFDFTNSWGIMSGFTQPYLVQFPPDSVNGIPLADYTPSGTGSSGDPYLISSLENLYWLSQSDSVWDDNAYFQQTTDIDASITSTWDDSAGFSPIGLDNIEFNGNYDGNGLTISNLFINRPTQDRIGLFGDIESTEIDNLRLTNVNITGQDRTGGLFGVASSGTTITNCFSSGIVSGDSEVGGLGGLFSSVTISSGNYSSASVIGSSSTVGGLFGYIGNVRVRDSYATGSVSGNSDVGGLIGSYESDGTYGITRNFATGSVSGTDDVGGLIGSAYSLGEFSDSYATGSVSGTDNVGGLIGLIDFTDVENSYSTGSVTGSSNIGGLVGRNFGGVLTSTYWDTQTSGQSNGIGSDNNGQSPIGLTSSQMQFQSNFSGFDFSTNWGIVNGFSEPYLQIFAPDSVAGHPIAWFPAGEGTSGNPYQIATLDNLFILSQEESMWDSDFIQTADIDASATFGWDEGTGFSPIGRDENGFRFEGTYKGKGHTISGLTINRPTENYIGLFGDTRNASIDSLNLVDLNFIGLNFVGGLVGNISFSDISYIYTSGTITVDRDNDNSTAGGIAGSSTGDQQNLVSSVHITANGNDVGGIFGEYSFGVLTDSYATGDISGGLDVGGLIGNFQFTGSGEALHRVYATGDVSGNTNVGGLIGSSSDNVVITNSFATGSVQGSRKIGGFIGYFIGNGTISSSYASGSVSGAFDEGGFIGENEGTITNSYWNTQTSGQSNGIGTDNNSQTVTGLTIQEMAQQSNFSGFDFSGTWGIVDIFSEPYLKFNTPDSINGIALGDFPSGAGTEGDPILISNLTHLEALSQSSSAWGSVFQQTANIDASETSTWNSGAGFSPIGTDGNRFDGNYDGNGRTISNLFINRPTESVIGLFGAVTNSEIQDLGLTDVQITGSGRVGALFGAAYGSTIITNTHSSGTVNGATNVGGLGGLLESDSTATSNYSSASVTAFSTGSGGLFGNVTFTSITDSYATGSVHGQSSAGGLIGDFPGISGVTVVLRSFATGSVSGTSDVGGLVGFAATVAGITDSYATGSVSGTNNVGGLIGNNQTSHINTSYASGSVSGSGTLGGLIGTNSGGSTVTAAYWDTTTSGQTTGIGFDDNSQSATGLSSAQMQQASSFSGFDFSTTWGIANGFLEPFLRVFPLPDIADYPPSTVPTGSGTLGDPFLIASIENLYWLSQTDSVWNDNAYFQQTGDIDASESYLWDSGKGFTPIGDSPSFNGNYDGGGHTISGVFIDRPNNNEIGFFSATNGAQISDLGLTEMEITGNNSVGGVSGLSIDIELYNVYVTGTITGKSEVGGLLGYTTSAYVSDSYSKADVIASNDDIGGIIGYFDGTDSSPGDEIVRSYSTGTITGANDIGGLVGDVTAYQIIDSYTTGSVSGTGADIGGLTGTGTVNIVTSYSSASVSGSSNTGGLVGRNSSSSVLTSTYWNTESSGQSNGIGSDGNSQSPTGLTSSQMQFQSNFSGFDFSTTWGIVNGFSEPYLQNFAPDSVAGHPTAWFPAGEGTSADPYQIATLDNLFILSQEESMWDADFIQTADIDASPTAVWDDSAGFSPIGRDELGSNFEGSYKGKGHTITGLTIKRPTEEYIGFFGETQGASIDSLNLVDLSIRGQRFVGGLAGKLRLGTVSNIYTSGRITSEPDINDLSLAGGIAGTGGVYNMENLASSANVVGKEQVGGLFGEFTGSLSNSYATGTVSGTNEVGGLIGLFSWTDAGEALHRVYATGDVSGTQDVGGLIGQTEEDVVITNSFATGSVQGSSNIGGFIGFVNNNGNISESYAIGSVSGGSRTGAFIGENDGTITNSYWNTETSGQSNAIGNDTNGQTVTGLTIQEMTQQSSFSGLDFSGTWSILNAFSEPYLQFSIPDSVNGFAFADFPSGSGTEGDPILISTLTHLDILSQSSTAWNSAFLQTADIDASATSGWNSEAGFIPIGENSYPFKGDYDGGGNEISNLVINRPNDSNTGFFGEVDSTTISNLGLVNADVTGSSNTGTLAGFVNNGSVIRNVYSTGSVDGGASTGGLIGTSRADSVYKAYSTADINSEANSTGGLIGTLTTGILTNSYAGGSIYGSFRVGGLVGLSSPGSIITNSYSTGSVDGSDSDFGGLIGGVFGSTISTSYWNTDLSGQNSGIGNTSGDATGLTTAQMIDSTNFSGFDFSETGAWNIDDGFTFPYLRALKEHRMVVATIDSGEGWRMIGNPGNVTYSELLDPLWTQGFTGADTESGSSNVYFYEETTQAWTAPSKANDYFGKADSNSVNTALNGILLYVYGDDDNDGNQDSWPKYIVSENATLNQSYNVSLGYTDNVSADSAGWNLISNPYPVSLDWTELVSNEDNTSTFPVAYVWDNTLNNGNGSYQVILGYPLPPGLTQDYLSNDPVPAMQSFWVKASATGASLDIKPDQQAASSQLLKQHQSTPEADTDTETGWLSLTVSTGDFSDQLVLFTSDAYKAPKLNTIASRYTEISIADTSGLWTAASLAGLEAGEQATFPIHLSTTETGNFNMQWDGLDSFDDDWNFEFIDKLTGESVSLSEGDSYSFELKTSSAAKLQNEEKSPLERGFRGVSVSANELGATRFELRVTVGTLVSDEPDQALPVTYALAQNYPNPFNPSTNIQFELPESGNVELLVFDILGRQVARLIDDRMEAGYHQIRFNASRFASGVYLYQLRAGGTVITKKLTLIK